MKGVLVQPDVLKKPSATTNQVRNLNETQNHLFHCSRLQKKIHVDHFTTVRFSQPTTVSRNEKQANGYFACLRKCCTLSKQVILSLSPVTVSTEEAA